MSHQDGPIVLAEVGRPCYQIADGVPGEVGQFDVHDPRLPRELGERGGEFGRGLVPRVAVRGEEGDRHVGGGADEVMTEEALTASPI